MLVSEILTEVKRLFGDESGVQITDTDIIRWVNRAQREIVRQNEDLLQSTGLASTIAGTNEYSFPVDYLNLKALHYKPAGQTSFYALRGLSKTDFDMRIGGLGSGSSYMENEPIYFTVYGGKFYLYPTPAVSGSSDLKLFYSKKPATVSSGLDTPELPELYHDTLVELCLQYAYEVDEDVEAAESRASKANADMMILRDRDSWSARDTYPTITLLPEDY